MADNLEEILARSGDIPILGQTQIPVMSGININGSILTIHEINQLTEEQFRELVLAIFINLMGGVYSPAPPLSSTVLSGGASTSASAEVIKADGSIDNA